MTLWIILTIMTSAAAVLVSRPIFRRFDRPQPGSSGDIEVYRDQLKEIENELARDVIDATQAETVRVEIKRRLLAADNMERPVMPSLSLAERNFAVICVTGFVVLGSVSLYALTGNPDLPSARRSGPMQKVPAASAADSSAVERLATLVAAPAAEGDGPTQAQAGLPPVDEMVQRLAARLQRNPKDAQGWNTLGWAYLNTGRYTEAAEAYAKAIELSPTVVDIRSARIEALVKSANGLVTAEARSAIEDTLKLDPKDARARFFKGLVKEQAGDKASALADWIGVLKDATPNEPWVSDLKSRISEIEGEIGDKAATSQPGSSPATPGGMLETLRAQEQSRTSGAAIGGPSRDQVQAAEAMPPGDRMAMIRGMVDGLATRLEKSPRDADGWIKLIRSRMVLGEPELAKQALERSLEVFAEDPQQRAQIAAAAQQLGLQQ